jgi:hypothetical protein
LEEETVAAESIWVVMLCFEQEDRWFVTEEKNYEE